MKKICLLTFCLFLGTVFSEPLCVDVVADRADQAYACGETATFTVTVRTDKGEGVRAGKVTAMLDNFGPKVVRSSETFDLAKTNVFTVSGTLREPGFLRLVLSSGLQGFPVTQHESNRWFAAVGFDRERIAPARPCPEDFDAFWRRGREEAGRLPLDVREEPDAGRSDGNWSVSRVSFATLANRRVYGWITRPKNAEGRLPARVQIAAAGFGNWSQQPVFTSGHVTLFMTVFPFPPDVKLRKGDYDKLNEEGRRAWGAPRYQAIGISSEDARDGFFYPVILGIDRAVDWFAERADVDPKRLTYCGTSQGGGLGLFLLALNRKFARAAIHVPALTDHYGLEKGHDAGWPDFIATETNAAARVRVERNAAYFDGVNFARRVTTPVFVTCGTSDAVCHPTCVWTAYNLIPAKEKTIRTGFGMTHGVWRDLYGEAERWLAR